MTGYFLIGLYLELICLYAYASPITQQANVSFTMSTKGSSEVASTITIFPNGPNKSSTPTNLQDTKRMNTSTTSTTPTTTTTTTPTSTTSLTPSLTLTTTSQRTQPTITPTTTTTSTTTVVVEPSSAATAMTTTMRPSIAATSMTVPLQTSSQMRSTTTVQNSAFTTPAPTKGTNTFATFISAITTVPNTRPSETAQSPPDHYERLLEDIFKGYDKKIMPFSNEKIPVTIAETVLGCILVQVVEKSQIASYVITRKQNWTDPRFQWNPAKYGGIKNILVPADHIWLADVFNYNK
uniref:Neurotransmitter-gated ion-channel ligand-binding domain-containing protein n=1 Tax=Acrobeloides nanus TaxID=290746 RepID=A0A914EJC0_9BILA